MELSLAKKRNENYSLKQFSPRLRAIQPRGFTSVVLGDSELSEAVYKSLKKGVGKTLHVKEISELLKFRGGGVDAIIVAGAVGRSNLSTTIHQLCTSPIGHKVPIYTVVPDWTDLRTARSLYANGTRVIFEWPKESASFPNTVKRLLFLDPEPGKPASPDSSLKEAVKLRLKLIDVAPKDLNVTVFRNIALIDGNVNSPWEKQLVKSLAEEVPGVKSASATSVKVDGSDFSEQSKELELFEQIKKSAGVNSRTLAVSVSENSAQITGVIPNASGMSAVKKAAAAVNGVDSVESHVKLSLEDHIEDAKRAKELKGKLKEKFPSLNISLSLFGSTAILRGEIDRKLNPKRVREAIYNLESIEKVYDKMKYQEEILFSPI